MQNNGKLFIQTEPILELVGYVPKHFKERLVSDMRPIDADALAKRLKHSPLFLGTNLQFKDGVIDLVEKQPALDVVPREEVERIKQETAREIFAEIEKWLPVIDYPIIAELKKKYTEDWK